MIDTDTAAAETRKFAEQLRDMEVNPMSGGKKMAFEISGKILKVKQDEDLPQRMFNPNKFILRKDTYPSITIETECDYVSDGNEWKPTESHTWRVTIEQVD